ncbi:MAG: ATP-binding protein [Bryobacteraceae bacterium]
MSSERTWTSASWRGYLLAVATVAAATAITFGILQTFGPRPHPAIFYSYIVAIMAAAWSGYGPGLFACGLSLFVAPYFLLPNFTPTRVDPNRIVLTALVSLLVSWVSASRKRSDQLLREANEELEARVKERTAQLERSNAELEQYAYAASHDLQEPLRTIAVYVQMLRRRYTHAFGEADAEQIMQTIETNTRRMSSLISDLLSHSRLTADAEAQFTPVSMSTVVAEAIDNCQSSIAETGATVRAPAELPVIRGNREQLMQVVQNLLANALKYRSPDRTPQVEIHVLPEDSRWMFAVRDNGIGLDMHYAERIFQMFKRLHGRDVPGTGMGLAICQKIIQQHGGRIWVESAPGVGATFKFTIPK